VLPPSQSKSNTFIHFPMSLTKPNKSYAQGTTMRAPHSASARKSCRVPRPTFKVADSLTSLSSYKSTSRRSLMDADSVTSRSSSPSRPPLKATASFASLSSSSSRPPLKAADSLASLSSTTSPQSLQCPSRATSPDSDSRTHISVTDSEVEVDPQSELGTHTFLLSYSFTERPSYQTTSKRHGAPLFTHSSSPTYLFSTTMAGSATSSRARRVSVRLHLEACVAFKTQRTRPQLQICVITPSAALEKML
jgi:hypothetical protein